jgi:hypothetical protein
MLTGVQGKTMGKWGERLVRFFFFAYIVIAFPTGYVIMEAFNGNAAARALLLDPAAFIAARSQGPRGPIKYATSKPSKARHDPPAASPDPGLLPPDTEAFLPPPRPSPGEPDPGPSLPGGLDFGLAGPFESAAASGGPFDMPFGFFPSDESPGFILPPPNGPGPPAAPAPPINAGPPSPSQAVPEPETWFIMLVGLAMTGAALRRRGTAASREA